MKTTILQHSFFPTGKGLVIIWNDELHLFYYCGGRLFNVWSTSHIAPKNPDELRLFMDMANTFPKIAEHGCSQSGTLTEIMEDIPDTVLGGIYEAVVGYNPFAKDQDSTANRNLVCEYLTMPETLKEVFNA
jgi:hypothetical protein